MGGKARAKYQIGAKWQCSKRAHYPSGDNRQASIVTGGSNSGTPCSCLVAIQRIA
jgi:hypothetical protein